MLSLLEREPDSGIQALARIERELIVGDVYARESPTGEPSQVIGMPEIRLPKQTLGKGAAGASH